MAAVLIGSVASVLALVNSLARIPSLLAGLGRAGPSLRAGGSTRETVADSGGPKLQGGAELAPMLKFLRPPSSGKGSWEERTSAVAI